MKVTIKHKGFEQVADGETWAAVADEMVAKYGAWVPGESQIIKEQSTFSNVVHDSGAEQRINKAYDALEGAGVQGLMRERTALGFKPGDRMADIGYAHQRERAIEHESKELASVTAKKLASIIETEKRHDVVMTCGDVSEALSINGALAFNGYKLREQAIKGLLGRIGSPATHYIFGLRDRIKGDEENKPSEDEKAHDRQSILLAVQRELQRFSKTKVKARMRDGLHDIFAFVSPSYGVADAPGVLPDVLRNLPDDARASFSYDPATTAWDFRASVFTPTPADEQAVGEPFEGYVAFGSRDNGTRRLTGGGGILLLQCLNASTYAAASSNVSRMHRGNILVDLHTMTRDAMKAIHALCMAWGTARKDVIAAPHDESGVLIPLSVAVPGFYRHMLTARRGELVGVLPGRTEHHVEKLALAFNGERRNSNDVVRADLANGWTKYIQTADAPVRRDAEAAIARWVVNGERVAYAAA